MNACENSAYLRSLAFETLVTSTSYGSRVFIDPVSCARRLGDRPNGIWSLLCAFTPVAVQVCSTDMFAFCADVHRRFCKLFSHCTVQELGTVKVDMEWMESTRSGECIFHLRVDTLTVAVLTQVPAFSSYFNEEELLTTPVWLSGYDEAVMIVHISILDALALMPNGLLHAAFLEALHVLWRDCTSVMAPMPAAVTLPAITVAPLCVLDVVTLENINVHPFHAAVRLELMSMANVDIPSQRDVLRNQVQVLKTKLTALQENVRTKQSLVTLHTRQAKVDVKPISLQPIPKRTFASVSAQTAPPVVASAPAVTACAKKTSSRKDGMKGRPQLSVPSDDRLARVCRQVEDRLFSYRPQGFICDFGPTKQEVIAEASDNVDELLEVMPKTFLWCAKLQVMFERAQREAALGNAFVFADFAGGSLDVQEERDHYFQYMLARVLAEPDDLHTRQRLFATVSSKHGVGSAVSYQQIADDAKTILGRESLHMLKTVGCSAGITMDADTLTALQNVALAILLQGAKCHAFTNKLDFEPESYWELHKDFLAVQAFKFASVINMCFDFSLRHMANKTYMVARKILQVICDGKDRNQCFGMSLMCTELKHLLQTVKGLIRFLHWAKSTSSHDSASSPFQPGSFPPLSGIFMSFVREKEKK